MQGFSFRFFFSYKAELVSLPYTICIHAELKGGKLFSCDDYSVDGDQRRTNRRICVKKFKATYNSSGLQYVVFESFSNGSEVGFWFVFAIVGRVLNVFEQRNE